MTKIEELKLAGWTGAVDTAAVDEFIAKCAGQTPENIAKIINRLDKMVDRRENCNGADIFTMAATIDRLRSN